MTTLSSSTAFSMASDAAFRAAGTELNGWLSTVGLVQTGDTGQINWTTATRPLNAFMAGYEIWRFSDSSLYFKIRWHGNQANTATSCPYLAITVGTGSDGSGNITGVLISETSVIGTNSITGPAAGALPTYICHTADFFGIAYKCGADSVGQSITGFAIEKLVDTTGAASGAGITFSYRPASAAGIQNKITSSDATYGPSTSFCAVPGNVTNSSVGSDRQVFMHAYPSPRAVFSNFLGTVVNAELPIATTFTATLVGTTSHSYIALNNQMGNGNSSSGSANWAVAMLWE